MNAKNKSKNNDNEITSRVARAKQLNCDADRRQKQKKSGSKFKKAVGSVAPILPTKVQSNGRQ